MLVISILLVTSAIAAFSLGHSLWLLLADATFLHLVLVAVFIFVETIAERLFSLALMEPDAILI
jgi:hypothetical protein